jgi:hypothetical protein
MTQLVLNPMPLVGNYNLQLYGMTFTRVTELLTDPFDYRAIAAMFIEELEDEGCEDHPVMVMSIKPIFPGDEEREEIEYDLTVLMPPELARDLDLNSSWEFEVITGEELDTLPPKEVLPPGKSLWETYSDDDRERLVQLKMDEIGDMSLKDLAIQDLDQETDRFELDVYLIDGDTLQAIKLASTDPDELENDPFNAEEKDIEDLIRLGFIEEAEGGDAIFCPYILTAKGNRAYKELF